MKEVKPYNKFENKKTQIRKMFNNISKTYDFLNFLLSFNMDKIWRRKVINKINNNPKKILDIATGTADVAILQPQRYLPGGFGPMPRCNRSENRRVARQTTRRAIG